MASSQRAFFGVPFLDILGYFVNATGIRPLEQRLTVIREFPLPITQHKLREFLGLINFYRRFIPHCATISYPLHAHLKHTKRPSDTLDWTGAATAAFSDIKNALLYLSIPPPRPPLAS
jgi:hypothetical protein